MPTKKELSQELVRQRAAKRSARDRLKENSLKFANSSADVNWRDIEKHFFKRFQDVLVLYDLPPTNEGWSRLAVILAAEKFSALGLSNSPINKLPQEHDQKDTAFRDRAVKIAHANIQSGRFPSKLKAFQDAAYMMNCRRDSPIPDPEEVYSPINEYDVKNWYDRRAKTGTLPDIPPEYDDTQDLVFLKAASIHVHAVDALFTAASKLGAQITR